MKRFNLTRTSQYKNVDNFQRNAQAGHFVFQNEANFSPRASYLPMKISCKFGEATWSNFPLSVNVENLSTRGGDSVANAKPKYHTIRILCQL